jgi:hypothetical protein
MISMKQPTDCHLPSGVVECCKKGKFRHFYGETGVAGIARESFPVFRRFMEWKDKQIHLQ